ncbi:hypothetical protein OESDEN_01202 [Oesophagostomum dentatum]|uniref:Uncharacterized protein n=1 Tax=Oesophagostomum dentatum TaxID=61180 RepID=A0A0B1TTQ8_OESDE|nr:hypothetical protein OESDEN_01202 [Oesophagostomum dentatum]
MASCFDPLGLMTPLLTKTKIFLQDLNKNKLKLGWDDTLSRKDFEPWNTIQKEMINLTVPLPRRVTGQTECKNRTLSVFVDSSKRPYACAGTQEGR